MASSSESQHDLPIFGFAHIAAVNHWREIVGEQIALIRSSKLYERTGKLYATVLGNNEPCHLLEDPKIEIVHRGADLQEYEFPALNYLRATCETHQCLVYYIHTKGAVRHLGSTAVTSWRKYMEYFIIEQHRRCIESLRSADVCGVDWCDQPWPHFSGNFWWSTSAYICTLPSPKTLNVSDRHQAEAWIGMNTTANVASLNQSNLNLYQNEYPRSAYSIEEEH